MVLVIKNPPATAGDARDTGSIPGSGRSPGGGHGNPVKYSCLENPIDKGVWWVTVHGITKSRTQLKACTQTHTDLNIVQAPFFKFSEQISIKILSSNQLYSNEKILLPFYQPSLYYILKIIFYGNITFLVMFSLLISILTQESQNL